MNIADVIRGERGFTITWDDDSIVEFPFIWLRDNDPDDLHPVARERVFDLTSVALDVEPSDYELNGKALYVHWPDKTATSRYDADWLHRHQPGRTRDDPARVEQTCWNRETLASVLRVDAEECATDPAVLMQALKTLKRIGLVIIDNLDDSPDAALQFARLVGFTRRTNFGSTWEVISKPDPNNLAYTPIELPLHTDLPNQERIPGYQFLHAYKNSAAGGESVFADGFRIAADLEAESPRDFELLCTVPVPFRFHDGDNDIRQRRPLISRHPDGRFDTFVFNAHIADLPDMETGLLYDFYDAYRALMQRIREPRYAVSFRLQPGEMVAFDNTRVLHGRAAFDPDSGVRHYIGYYLDRNEIDSRIRVLARALAEEQLCPSK